MFFLEMSRNEAHGGPGWGFKECLWSPIRTTNGGQWPFWKKILDVQIGDAVLHLRGKGADASFVGYSYASSSGYETGLRPPDPGPWAYSKKFYRANLEGFTPLTEPVRLSEVFFLQKKALTEYFHSNKALKNKSRNIFFVMQSGKLQCLNGAYISEVDSGLFAALFEGKVGKDAGRRSVISVQTGQQLATVKARLGQAAFSKELKALYKNSCCFPGCEISDVRFLIASHIARWSDNDSLRGNLGNGLCLCLMHDKAFEIGLFTLDDDHRIIVRPELKSDSSVLAAALVGAHGRHICRQNILPLKEAILEHRLRVNCDVAAWESAR